MPFFLRAQPFKAARRNVSRSRCAGAVYRNLVQRGQVVQEVINPLHVHKHVVVDSAVHIGGIVNKDHVTGVAGHKQVPVSVHRTLVQTPTYRGGSAISIRRAITPAPTHSIFATRIFSIACSDPFARRGIGPLYARRSSRPSQIFPGLLKEECTQIYLGQLSGMHYPKAVPIWFNLYNLGTTEDEYALRVGVIRTAMSALQGIDEGLLAHTNNDRILRTSPVIWSQILYGIIS